MSRYVADVEAHPHIFDAGNPLAERRVAWAVALTVVTMVAEIAGGWLFNSMALLADGWHMGSHALALGVSMLAYVLARRFAGDERFTFGAWKIEVLGGYTSAILLFLVAGLMAFHSAERLLNPSEIHYDQAIAIACVGLVVNLVCAWLLHEGHDGHGHDDHHGHHGHRRHEHHHHHYHDAPDNVERAGAERHQHGGHDINLRSAYLHVLADAATSILAVLALIGGKYWGAVWLDPFMGLAGSVLVALWAWGLMRDSGMMLLDAGPDDALAARIRASVEQAGDGAAATVRVQDLHVWRVGRDKYACILSLDLGGAADLAELRRRLAAFKALAHLTVEVRQQGTLAL